MSAALAITASLLVALPTHAQQVPAPGESPTVDKIKADGKIRADVAPYDVVIPEVPEVDRPAPAVH